MKRFLSLSGANARAALILGLAATVAVCLQFTQAFTGPLDLRRPAADYGKPNYETGPASWPRTAVDAAGYSITIQRPPRRIVSLYWSLDDYAYTVIPPDRIVGVSENAFLHRVSNVADLADRYRPAVAANPEVLLKLSPDLVLASGESETDSSAILRNGRVPVFQMFTRFRTLDEVANTILLTGYLSGEDESARVAHDAFAAAVDRAQRRRPAGMKPPRILGLSGRFTYGDETLFHDIVRTLGGVNVAGENGLHGYDAVSSELVLRWDPEWIVTGADAGEQGKAMALITNDPAMALTTAVRKGQVMALDNKIFLPMSPYTVLLLDALGRAVYPENP